MGKIIVIDDEGVSHEYERGIVYGFNHAPLKRTNPFHQVDVDAIKMDICEPELVYVFEMMQKDIEKKAKEKISRLLQNGEFPNFMEFMVNEALKRGEAPWK